MLILSFFLCLTVAVGPWRFPAYTRIICGTVCIQAIGTAAGHPPRPVTTDIVLWAIIITEMVAVYITIGRRKK